MMRQIQSRTDSAKEAVANMVLAFTVSLYAHKFIVAPELAAYVEGGGNQESWEAAAAITAFYTILSLSRIYVLRRLYEAQ